MSFWGNNVSGQGQDRYVKASQGGFICDPFGRPVAPAIQECMVVVCGLCNGVGHGRADHCSCCKRVKGHEFWCQQNNNTKRCPKCTGFGHDEWQCPS